METEKALDILDEVLDEYDAKQRRDVLIVLRAARALLVEHGMPGDAKRAKRRPRSSD